MFINQQNNFPAWTLADSFLHHKYEWCYRTEMKDETQLWLFGA